LTTPSLSASFLYSPRCYRTIAGESGFLRDISYRWHSSWCADIRSPAGTQVGDSVACEIRKGRHSDTQWSQLPVSL